MEILQTKSSKQRREPIQKSMVKKINLMEDLFGLANGAANQKLVYLLPYVGGFISASKYFSRSWT